VAQLAEADPLKGSQCRFESDRGYRWTGGTGSGRETLRLMNLRLASPGRRRIGLAVAAGLLLTAACTRSAPPPAPSTARPAPAPATAARQTPGAAWEVVPPASVGLDRAALDTVAAAARDGKSSCLVVARQGKLAGDWHFGGS
jgi:hypothetical protein